MTSRLGRVLVVLSKMVGLAAIAAVALVGGAFLHLRLRAPRAFAVSRVNRALQGSFRGTILVRDVRRLGATHARGVDIDVYAPNGTRVLALREASASLDTLRLFRSVVSGGRLDVVVSSLDVASVDAVIEENERGSLTIAETFAPTSTAPGRGADISLPRIAIRHAALRSSVPSIPITEGELDGLFGSVHSTARMLELRIATVAVHARAARGLDPAGFATGALWLPAEDDAPLRSSVAYLGSVGVIPVAAAGTLDGARVDGAVVVPTTGPEAFNAVYPDRLKLAAPLGVDLTFHGVWPTVRARIFAQLGTATIDGSAEIVAPDDPRRPLGVRGALRATDINVADLSPEAPSSRMTLSVEGTAVVPSGVSPSGSFRIESEGGELKGVAIPRATIRGTAEGASVAGSGVVLEPGAPTTLRFAVSPDRDGNPSLVSFSTQTRMPDLHAIARLNPPASGAVTLVTNGSVNVQSKTLEVRASARIDHLDAEGIRLDTGSLDVTADGPLGAPSLTAELTGSNLASGAYAFHDVRLTGKGTPTDGEVTLALGGTTDAPDVDARAHFHVDGNGGARRLSIRNAEARLDRNDVEASVNVDSIDVAAGGVDLRGAKISGLGDSIALAGRKTGATLTLRATAPDVDVSRVMRLLGRKEDLAGNASVDLELSADRGAVEGRFVLDAHVRSAKGANLDLLPPFVFGGLSLSLPPVGALTAHFGAESKAHVLRATAELDADRVGTLTAEASNVTPDGSFFAARSWLRATGTVSLDLSARLARLVSHAPSATSAWVPTGGDLSIRAKLDRDSPNAVPNANVRISTSKLELTHWRSTTPLLTTAPTVLAPPKLSDIDGSAELTIADAGDRISINAEIHDSKGSIATFTGDASEGVRTILSDPEKALARLANAPLTAHASLHERTIDELDPLLAVVMAGRGEKPLSASVTGLVSGDVDLRGTLSAPELVATAEARHLVVKGPRCPAPVDVQAIFRYRDRAGELRAMVATNVPILKADATLTVGDEPLRPSGPLVWSLSGGLELMNFPLAFASHMLQTRIEGTASGTIRFADLHRDASLDASLSLKDAAIGHSTPTNVDLRATIEKTSFRGSVALHQPGGELRADAKGPISWGDAYVPTIARDAGIDVDVTGKNFRADAVRPFVASTFVALDGVIDADAHVHVDSTAEKSHVEGTISVRGGVFEVASIGERFHDVEARVALDPSGAVRVDRFVAEGPTGELTATGRGVVEGLTFKSGYAQIRIPKEQRIPLSVAGVPVGTASGDVTVDATMATAAHRLDVVVDVPSLLVNLPQSTGHSVQDLAANPNVRIGAASRTGFRAILLAPPSAEQASPLAVRVEIKLGKDVEVKRDTTLDVVFDGDAVIEVTDKTRVTGEIRLVRGKLDLEGKEFRIEHGAVTFTGGDASNPAIAARAHWEAPDGTRVYADYTGTPKAGSLRLSSEPALTQDQIVALILYGSTSSGFGGSNGSSQGSGDIAAVGLAGGILTQSVNRIISGVTSADVTTRIDSSVANNPEPEVVAQLTKTISARIGYKLGAAAPGDNPDRADVTVYWRFVKNWSLSADVGEEGSAALGIVWRLRY